MNNILKTLLYEWEKKTPPLTISRDYDVGRYIDLKINKATVITGFRRVGKTYLVFDYIKKLLKTYSKKEIVYLNFEDERLVQKNSLLTDLLPTIKEVFGKNPKYLFLDEIQVIPQWSKWVRRMIDTEDMKIIITGSSSKMSSFEIPTELRGRFFEIKVTPLAFREFLKFKNKTIDSKKISYLTDEKVKFNLLFEEYLVYGGLPETVLIPQDKKIELLQNYYQTVIQKEIIERFNVKNREGLKIILQLLLNSTYFTLSKLYNNLKSLSYKIGKTTLNNYLSYIESSYFLTSLYIHTTSFKNKLNYPRKAYFIDNGFITAFSTKFSKNYGRLFENMIFQILQKKDEELFYFKDVRGEVDFITFKDGKVRRLCQVCYDLADRETREREIKSLIRAGERFNCRDLRIMTKEKNSLILPKKIKIVTATELFNA